MRIRTLLVGLVIGLVAVTWTAAAWTSSAEQERSDQSERKERKERKQDEKKKKKKDKDKGAAVAGTLTAPVLPLYDKGAYDQVMTTVAELGEDAEKQLAPETAYVVAWTHEATGTRNAANAVYSRLAALPDTNAWHFIGASSAAVLAGDLDAALSAADGATALAPSNKYAHYQRGRVLVARQAYSDAAAAFVSSLEIDGTLAYGHYWAGFAYNKAGNLVSMTNHFRRFVELAPEAPERTQVEAILAAMR
jgi:tetratricopeptide (TPR) repeat protein